MPRPKFISILELTKKQIETFWANVRIGTSNECWPWKGYTNKKGYGAYNAWNSKKGKYQIRLTHRIAYALQFRKEPHICVLHHCDNPPCCNPHHLFEGTDQDNVIDRENKGRRQAARGSAAGLAVLTETDVIEIKKRLATYIRGDVRRIAKEFGVNPETISHIKVGRTWNHV